MTQEYLPVTLGDDERRVLQWLPARMSFAAIGAHIGLPGEAVEELAKTVYRKLGVSSRQDAVKRCAQLGMFPERQLDLSSSVEDLDEAFVQMKALRNARGEIVDFEYEYCNRAALCALGRRQQEVVGHYLLELFPTNLTNGLFDAFVCVIQTGEPLRRELAFDDGGVVGEFEVVVSRHGDGIVVAGHDISARKRYERELVLVRDQLQQALTSRVLIEQAKGFLAAKFGVDPTTAFAALRRHARNNNLRLADVAQAVVAGELQIRIPDIS